jgi:hypothetical protein
MLKPLLVLVLVKFSNFSMTFGCGFKRGDCGDLPTPSSQLG